MQGVFSPITVATKTIIGEIYPSSQQASAMSSFTLIWNIGIISGNVLGGFFEDPQTSNLVKNGFLADYPFLLPNIIIATIGVISLVLCIFFLYETKPKESLLEQSKPRSFLQIFTDPVVIQALSMYIICSFNGTAFTELLTLWVWAKKTNGGFEFNPDEIGILSGITTFILIFYIKTLYKKLFNDLGLILATKKSLIAGIPILLALPLISLLRYENGFK